jgi:hypothetical protein
VALTVSAENALPSESGQLQFVCACFLIFYVNIFYNKQFIKKTILILNITTMRNLHFISLTLVTLERNVLKKGKLVPLNEGPTCCREAHFTSLQLLSTCVIFKQLNPKIRMWDYQFSY